MRSVRNDEAPLTQVELETLTLIAQGLTNQEAAEVRGCKLSTIQASLARVRMRLDAKTTVQAAVIAAKEGWL